MNVVHLHESTSAWTCVYINKIWPLKVIGRWCFFPSFEGCSWSACWIAYQCLWGIFTRFNIIGEFFTWINKLLCNHSLISLISARPNHHSMLYGYIIPCAKGFFSIFFHFSIPFFWKNTYAEHPRTISTRTLSIRLRIVCVWLAYTY